MTIAGLTKGFACGMMEDKMGMTGWLSVAPLMGVMALVIAVGLLALMDGTEA